MILAPAICSEDSLLNNTCRIPFWPWHAWCLYPHNISHTSSSGAFCKLWINKLSLRIWLYESFKIVRKRKPFLIHLQHELQPTKSHVGWQQMSLFSPANCVWGGSCSLSPVGFGVNKYPTASYCVRTTKATEVTTDHDRVLWIEREKCSTFWHEVKPLLFNVIFTKCYRGIEVCHLSATEFLDAEEAPFQGRSCATACDWLWISDKAEDKEQTRSRRG